MAPARACLPLAAVLLACLLAGGEAAVRCSASGTCSAPEVDEVSALQRQTTQRQGGRRPNIVWILTDDQDQALGGGFPPTAPGGATPMPKTKRLLQDEGLVGTNWYVHTPICSPSRAETLSGRYFHNIKMAGPEPIVWSMHVNETFVNNNTFARILKEQGGYATGLFGKYLNVMPHRAPPGFDAWFANGGGHYIAPSFQTYGIEGLEDGWTHFDNAPGNYSTSLIGNYSIDWIKRVHAEGKPFFAYIAPKAVHEPFNPAVWYRDAWEPSWPEHEPRGDNWNCSAESRRNHHGNIATQPMLTPLAAEVITGIFKNRWRMLMSVDDLIADLVQAVKDMGEIDNTYFLYASDHGFQLGQFNIPMDKRHIYEWDTKVFLLARGPGIKPGTEMPQPGTNVDIAPTILDLAGIKRDPEAMDGRSIAPLLLDASDLGALPAPTRARLLDELGEDADGGAETYRANWRQELFHEYYFVNRNPKCIVHCEPTGHYPQSDAMCADLTTNTKCWCNGNAKGCYLTEDRTNNWMSIRRFGAGNNVVYAEFEHGDLTTGVPINFTNVDFKEHYDLDADPSQLNNLAADEKQATLQEELSQRLREWLVCKGSSCP